MGVEDASTAHMASTTRAALDYLYRIGDPAVRVAGLGGSGATLSSFILDREVLSSFILDRAGEQRVLGMDFVRSVGL